MAPENAELSGILHLFVAFDWGDELSLDRARNLVASAPHAFPRRPRTPPSFSYSPAPLHVPVDPLPLELPGIGGCSCEAIVTLFDFAAGSLALSVPFRLTPRQLLDLAASLANPTALLEAARTRLRPLHQRLLPALEDASWQEDLSEEYMVFQFGPEAMRLAEDAPFLAGLGHLDAAPLSTEEIAESVRHRLSYSPHDLFIPNWTAAVLIDENCEETLEAIEFANLQLLEFRNIDNRLDDRLHTAARTLHPWDALALAILARSWPAARALGELKVEANALFERTSNALKLVGDPYLARVYRLVAGRFHLETWEENIRRKLEVAEGVYQVVSDQASHFRAEFLEVIVVVLILVEIVLAFVH